MTSKFALRVKAYKNYLRRLIKSKKGMAYEITLTRPTALEIAEHARLLMRGTPFTNTARDIRRLTEMGDYYDPEFDLLLRGQTLPYIIESYSEKYLAGLIKGIIAPSGMDARLADLPRTTPDGRKLWEEV